MHGISTIQRLNARRPEIRISRSSSMAPLPPEPPRYDEVGNIIAYENGDLDEDGIIELFQHLVDNGHAWSLQGHYGRTAAALIDAGLVVPPGGGR
jgi:hypothetical protein